MNNSGGFEVMLTGGHPNSLGRTLEVVQLVLQFPARVEQLYACYSSQDAVVRLRTSSAFKRIIRENPQFFDEFAERLIDTVSKIDQDSARWTVAQLLEENTERMDDELLARAKKTVLSFFDKTNDWIVLCNSLKALVKWSENDAELRKRTRSLLNIYSGDPRKSVSRTCEKLLKNLSSLG